MERVVIEVLIRLDLLLYGTWLGWQMRSASLRADPIGTPAPESRVRGVHSNPGRYAARRLPS